MTTKLFHISDIISITDGRLVSTRHMDGVYDILGFMANEDLMTHMLPAIANTCKPELLKQHPQLAELVDPDVKLNENNFHEWVQKQVDKFGETLPVTSLGSEDLLAVDTDPISTLETIMGAPVSSTKH